MKSFIAILLSMLVLVSGVPTTNITEENISQYLAPDHQSVAKFIVNNLSQFVDEYNKQLSEGENQFKATSCEFSAPVFVQTLNQTGTYLDFNDDNGYMVVVDDYSVVAFETTGDLEYLRNDL